MDHLSWISSVLPTVLLLVSWPALVNLPGLTPGQEEKFVIMVSILALLSGSWLLWRERRKRADRIAPISPEVLP